MATSIRPGRRSMSPALAAKLMLLLNDPVVGDTPSAAARSTTAIALGYTPLTVSTMRQTGLGKAASQAAQTSCKDWGLRGMGNPSAIASRFPGSRMILPAVPSALRLLLKLPVLADTPRSAASVLRMG